MPETHEFIRYCAQILEVNFGQLYIEIINKARSNKNLNYNSNINDFKEFIDLIELNIKIFSGKNKAVDICSVLMTKAVEIIEKQETPDNAFDKEKIDENFKEDELKELLLKEFSNKMDKQEFSHLIKDEPGFSNQSLSEFVELMTPSEQDIEATLEGLGLKHMIKKK